MQSPSQEIEVVIHPRPHFREFVESSKRWAVLVAHRRAGKTVAVIQKLVRSVLTHSRRGPPLRYAYIAPTRDQAKDIAWEYLKDYTESIPGTKINESELRITFHDKAQIRLYSGENYERMRGLFFDGVVTDEDADIPPEALTYVILPCLLDYKGWHARIGTARGRTAFHRAFNEACKSEDHYTLMLKASESGILSEESLSAVKQAMIDQMGKARAELAYRQEMECDFTVSRPGAIFAKYLQDAREEGRVSADVAWYKEVPCYTCWDLGAAVNTKCWIFQIVGDRIIWLESLTGDQDLQDPSDWVKTLSAKRYRYGGHFLPHDGEVYWQRALNVAGLEHVFCVGRPQIVWDPINEARQAFPRFAFNEEWCELGIDALDNYHSKEERDAQTVTDVPVHDWSSHFSSALCTGISAINSGMIVDRSAMPGRPHSEGIDTVFPGGQVKKGRRRRRGSTRAIRPS